MDGPLVRVDVLYRTIVSHFLYFHFIFFERKGQYASGEKKYPIVRFLQADAFYRSHLSQPWNFDHIFRSFLRETKGAFFQVCKTLWYLHIYNSLRRSRFTFLGSRISWLYLISQSNENLFSAFVILLKVGFASDST